MENEKLQNGINEIRQIKMTNEEKNQVFENILKTSPIKKPVQSPWFSYSFMVTIKKYHLAYYVILPLIVLTGGGFVFASENSLPSSPLYPLKVEVVEPIKGALTLSPTKRAQYESSLATERLIEAEVLVSQGKLDIEKESKINVLLEKHTNSLNKSLEKVSQTTSSRDADEIVIDFRAQMNAHARVLDIMESENEDSKYFNKDNGVSKTARENASKVKISIDDDEKEIANEYDKKKDKIESMVIVKEDKKENKKENNQENKKETEFSITTASPMMMMAEEEEEDKTEEIFDKAQYYLDEAEKMELNGDQDGAYNMLLEYESSIKEESIFSEYEYKINKDH